MTDTNDTQAELAAWELLAEARRERDEWKQLAIQYSAEREHNAMQSLIYKAERDEARGQRDSLAAALKAALHDLETSDGLMACDNEEGHSLFRLQQRSISKATEALQSLTPNQP